MRQVVARRAGGPEAPTLHRWWADILAWLERDEIAPRIDRVLPLERAAEAHAHLDRREKVGIAVKPKDLRRELVRAGVAYLRG